MRTSNFVSLEFCRKVIPVGSESLRRDVTGGVQLRLDTGGLKVLEVGRDLQLVAFCRTQTAFSSPSSFHCSSLVPGIWMGREGSASGGTTYVNTRPSLTGVVSLLLSLLLEVVRYPPLSLLSCDTDSDDEAPCNNKHK